MAASPILGIVVPCYNEDEILEQTAARLVNVIDQLMAKGKIRAESFVFFVDDGSAHSWEIIESLHRRDQRFKGLKFSANFGHQKALLAGLLAVRERVDCALSIDADLQDDLSVVEIMLDKISAGCDIVYGVKNRRDCDGFLKALCASFFYRLQRFFGIKNIYNHADFRMVTRRVIDTLEQFSETNVYLRGLFPLMGFPSAQVTYDLKPRMGGKSKYSLGRMAILAVDGITAFSPMPLRLIASFGLFISAISFLMGIYSVVSYLNGHVIQGWTSTVVAIYFLGGIQLLSMGIIGEYISKTYGEVKRRPRYIKEKELF